MSISETASSMNSTIIGIGSLSGRALMSLGELTLRGVESVNYRVRLLTIANQLAQAEVRAVPDRTYDVLLELQRPTLYSDRIRFAAWDLILSEMEFDRTVGIAGAMLRWPWAEVELFLRQLAVSRWSNWENYPASNVKRPKRRNTSDDDSHVRAITDSFRILLTEAFLYFRDELHLEQFFVFEECDDVCHCFEPLGLVEHLIQLPRQQRQLYMWRLLQVKLAHLKARPQNPDASTAVLQVVTWIQVSDPCTADVILYALDKTDGINVQVSTHECLEMWALLWRSLRASVRALVDPSKIITSLLPGMVHPPADKDSLTCVSSRVLPILSVARGIRTPHELQLIGFVVDLTTHPAVLMLSESEVDVFVDAILNVEPTSDIAFYLHALVASKLHVDRWQSQDNQVRKHVRKNAVRLILRLMNHGVALHELAAIANEDLCVLAVLWHKDAWLSHRLLDFDKVVSSIIQGTTRRSGRAAYEHVLEVARTIQDPTALRRLAFLLDYVNEPVILMLSRQEMNIFIQEVLLRIESVLELQAYIIILVLDKIQPSIWGEHDEKMRIRIASNFAMLVIEVFKRRRYDCESGSKLQHPVVLADVLPGYAVRNGNSYPWYIIKDVIPSELVVESSFLGLWRPFKYSAVGEELVRGFIYDAASDTSESPLSGDIDLVFDAFADSEIA